MSIRVTAVALGVLGIASSAVGEDMTTISMSQRGAEAYYVEGRIAGSGPASFMVDTGSGYTVIDQATLEMLEHGDRVSFIKPLQATLADGSNVIIPVYRIDRITIGEACALHDVEAAVLPNADRPILGLRALRRLSPFQLSFEPPQLALTGCVPGPVAGDAAPREPAGPPSPSGDGVVPGGEAGSSDVALGTPQG